MVCRLVLSPLNYTSQGWFFFLITQVLGFSFNSQAPPSKRVMWNKHRATQAKSQAPPGDRLGASERALTRAWPRHTSVVGATCLWHCYDSRAGQGIVPGHSQSASTVAQSSLQGAAGTLHSTRPDSRQLIQLQSPVFNHILWVHPRAQCS